MSPSTVLVRAGGPIVTLTAMSSLVSQDHRETVERRIYTGVHDGARLRTGGARPGGDAYDAGSYLQPTVSTQCSNTAPSGCEEVFGRVLEEMLGPVLSVLTFDDVDQAAEVTTTPTTASRLICRRTTSSPHIESHAGYTWKPSGSTAIGTRHDRARRGPQAKR